MDVVPSTTNPKELFVYLVNHQPFVGQDATKSGANSTIEIFRTKVGGSAMTHLHTVHSPSVIISPNDIVGLPDGKSFYFTNDAGAKTGLVSLPNPRALIFSLNMSLFRRSNWHWFCVRPTLQSGTATSTRDAKWPLRCSTTQTASPV